MAKTFGKGINPMKGQDEDKPDLDPTRGLGEQAMERMIGKLNIPDDERETIKPLPLTAITPDRAQPRKAIPKSVSKAARQDNIPEWQAWHRIAEQLHGQPIDLKAILRGESSITPADPTPHALLAGFLSLAGLASSIARDKLTNAITVVRVPGTAEVYEIETGERRYQAHILLYAVLGKEKYSKIKARIVEKASIWRQASENGEREELTAIGMARQMALLLMEWYRENKGTEFQSYRDMVQEGESDRAFYAQIADGYAYKVPDGHLDSFLRAIGLKSKNQLTRIRALLDTPDDLWVKGDEENWSEWDIRQEVARLKNSEWLPHGNHSDADDTITGRNGMTSNPPTTPAPLNATGGPLRWPLEGEGVRYMWHQGQRVQLESSYSSSNGIMVARVWKLKGDNRERAYTAPMSELKDTPPAPGLFQKPAGIDYDKLHNPYPASASQDILNQIFRHKSGRFYQVTGTTSNNKVMGLEVYEDGSRKGRIAEPLDRADLFAKPAPAAPSRADNAAFDLIGQRIFHHLGAYRYEGVVMDVKRDDSVGDFLVKIRSDDGKIEGPFLSKNVRVMTSPDGVPLRQVEENLLALADSVAAQMAVAPATPETPLPTWAHPGHIVVAPDPDEGEITGVVERSRWNSTDRTWMVLVHFGTHQGECTVDDLRARTDEPVHGLVDWAIIGQTVMDAHTNPMDIEDIVWDNSANNWRLQVRDTEGQLWDGLIDIYGPAFASVLEEAAPAPVARHPGMDAKNLMRVVSEMQGKLEQFRVAAVAFEMHHEAALITRFKVLTPNAEDAWLRDKGDEGAYAELESLWRACDAVTQHFVLIQNTVYNEAAELLRQKILEKNGAA